MREDHRVEQLTEAEVIAEIRVALRHPPQQVSVLELIEGHQGGSEPKQQKQRAARPERALHVDPPTVPKGKRNAQGKLLPRKQDAPSLMIPLYF